MKLYVLDTDIAGFLQHEHPTVISRINTLPETDTVATTIITFGEDLTGWLPACKRATDGSKRSRAYTRLQTGLEFYREMICLPFDSIALRSLINCAHSTDAWEPTTSQSQPSRFQSTVF